MSLRHIPFILGMTEDKVIKQCIHNLFQKKMSANYFLF